MVEAETKDGAKGQLSVTLHRNEVAIGGMTFLLTTATAFAGVAVYDRRGLPVPGAKVILWHPGDPRELVAETEGKGGIARFGPLNPGFYFAHTEGSDQPPVRVFIAPGEENLVKLSVNGSGTPKDLKAQNRS